MPTTPLAPGSVFAGDFEVVRLLADGGMGSVYVVEQRSTGKRRALKVMHPRLLRDPTLRERFTQEARLGARIQSDHVVEVVGAGLDAETGIPWMAMELLHGRDLAATLLARGALPLAEAQDIMRQAGHGLSRAHRLGIVHRDLKPENLFLADMRREGVGPTVKVLDFGIAKVMQETRATGATIGGLGTPLWMAPEQTHGGMITPATDVWALGLIGFALLTGRSYWRCATGDASLTVVLMEMFAAPMPPPSERVAELGLPPTLPPGFDEWFAQCVAREAGERFVSAEPCIAAFLALRSPSARAVASGRTQVGAPSVPSLPSRRRSRSLPALAAAAVLLPALALGAWIAARGPAHEVTARVAPTPVHPSSVESRAVVEPPAPPAPQPVAEDAGRSPAPVVRAASSPRRAAPTRRPAAPRAPSPPPVPAYSAAPRAPSPPPVPAYSAVREPPVGPAPVHPSPAYPSPAPVYPSPAPSPTYPSPAPVAGPTAEPPSPAPAPASHCGPCAQGMTERCNGCDDNCNGMVDEGC